MKSFLSNTEGNGPRYNETGLEKDRITTLPNLVRLSPTLNNSNLWLDSRKYLVTEGQRKT
ncbi:hypothetical protein NARC_40150 [Candidatus Nitrosocosmicus arcticus]|uniref:Uncharacterized protein n=1 Tax=Candidatus Nitrosocosmicus arcticus TaxID=2035267 RepID=A0A557SX51_9ARCH|nr:hypothetical protein NARC_40150 [Candidatus Nitrosocosmicus arcticus]